ncbi:aldose epimerase family protein [Niallia nealsonii]|uniref:Aldose 1-epimerase n=1 Tax=Niallia nealsonii TaxID=115979 RepID=A0A2N0Z548_9BACI|nr:aldose epimerase family protein [Niallia nealsonii]PKG24617.1 galactose-1-epimerase [Niallia nealsonii]
MKIEERVFGTIKNRPVIEYTLLNENGLSVSCLNYGCIITKIMAPDKDGKIENIVLGFDSLEDYIESPYFGSIVGRVAGRIRGAQFAVGGTEYRLSANTPPNHLHGGETGFSSKIFAVEKIEKENAVGIKFMYESPDGEEGYPGNLQLSISYFWNNENELEMTYHGKTDKETIVNITNHSYFNLSGNSKRDCLEHVLTVESDRFLELNEQLLPTGILIQAKDTSFDFQEGKKLKEGIESDFQQNAIVGNGYDHPLIFSESGKHTAELWEEESGRVMHVTTDQPAMILYTANQLDEDIIFNEGVKGRPYLGVCLETQGYPDAVHHSTFPSIVLKPEEKYMAQTTFRFTVY